MPFVDCDVLKAGDFARTRAKLFEVRNGGVAVEDDWDACLYMATGHLWPNSLYRRGKSQLQTTMPGKRPSTIEVYRRKQADGEFEWTVLFVFLGDVDELRRRRMLFYNAEMYVTPEELYRVQREVYDMKKERLEKAKASVARVEGGVIA